MGSIGYVITQFISTSRPGGTACVHWCASLITCTLFMLLRLRLTQPLLNLLSLVRARRAASPYAPDDAMLVTDVPEEFKVFPKGNKVALALFPWTGVGKLLLFSDTLHFRLLQLTNLALGGWKMW